MEKKLLKLKVTNWGLINKESLEYAKNLEKRGLINFNQTVGFFLLKGMTANPHYTSFGTITLISAAFWNEVYRICEDPTSPTVSELNQVISQIPELKTHYLFEYGEFGKWTMSLKSSDKKLCPEDWERFDWYSVFDVNGRFEYFPVTGSDFPVFIDLFRYLNGNYEKAEILEIFREHSSLVSQFLNFAESQDLMVVADEKPMSEKMDFFIKYISHSCLQVSEREHSVIIDPAFLVPPPFHAQTGAFDHFTDELSGLSDTTALVITHHHWDHLNLQTLIRFPREIPIYIPEPTCETYFNPSIKNYLNSLGFKNIITLREWQKIQVTDIQLTAVPFRGEWFGPGSSFDAFCYLVEVKGRKLLGSVDADRDERGDMLPIFQKLKERVDKIDFFFFGSSGKAHQNPTFCANPYLYSNKFNQQYENRMRYHPDHETVFSWCEIFRPSIVIPYAEFIFHNQDIRKPINLNRFDDYEGHFKYYWEKGLKTAEPELLIWMLNLKNLKKDLKKLEINMLMLGPGETIYEDVGRMM